MVEWHWPPLQISPPTHQPRNETATDFALITKALDTLDYLCGADEGDDADRVMLTLARQALDALVRRCSSCE
jgi:hypothetical protein